jgi:dihydroflavonol-4-reductase
VTTDTVLVTGASGFIAGHCIVELLQAGYRVRGTLRSLERADEVRRTVGGAIDPEERLTFVAADLLKDDGWPEAVRGCRYVLHVASPVSASLRRESDELIAAARDGTLRVMRASAQAGVQRVVQTSSVAAISRGHDRTEGHVFTEADWNDPSHPDNNAYSRSKAIAEKAAWAALPQIGAGLEWVAVNPSLVLGPLLSTDASVSIELVRKCLAGALPGYPRMGYGIVDVRDVARIHLLAMTVAEAAGERFIASGRFLWIEDVVKVLRERFPAYRRKLPKFRLPDALVRAAGWFDPVLRGQLHELGRKRELSAAKARRILGWTSRSEEEAIAASAESLIRLGVV